MEQKLQYIEDVIYSAALDDENLNAIPGILCDAFSARSCSLLWKSDLGNNIFLHSDYYSEDNLQDYFQNFADYDLWIAEASAPQRLNQAWLSSQAIEHDRFASSVFFNEWIRPMGDDTFHALGSSIVTAQGSGIIGLHRGRTQGDFDPVSAMRLNQVALHLRRMLAFRARLAAAENRAAQFQQGFHQSPGAVVIVDRELRIQMQNAAAETLFRAGDVVYSKAHHLVAGRAMRIAGLTRIIAAAARPAAPEAGSCCVREADGRFWKLSVMPLVSGVFAGSAMLQIEVSEPAAQPLIVAPRLQSLYGLTSAEAQIAVGIANGQSIAELAVARSSSEATVRTQLKTGMAKLAVHRQSDLAAIVTRLR